MTRASVVTPVECRPRGRSLVPHFLPSQYRSPVPVALNISSKQLRRESDRARFLQHLSELKLSPGDVEFELTESMLFDDLNNPDSILVPPGIPIVTTTPADRSFLKPGEYVFVGANVAGDGKITTSGRIQVSKDGVKPPQ